MNTAVTDPDGSLWPPADLAPVVLSVLTLAAEHRLYVAGRTNVTPWTDAEYESARLLHGDAATAAAVLLERGFLVEAWNALLVDESGDQVDADGVVLTPSGRELHVRLAGH